MVQQLSLCLYTFLSAVIRPVDEGLVCISRPQGSKFSIRNPYQPCNYLRSNPYAHSPPAQSAPNRHMETVTNLQTPISTLPIPATPIANPKTTTRPHIQRQSFPLAEPPATQSLVGWNCATAGTAVMSCASPSWASCWPSCE